MIEIASWLTGAVLMGLIGAAIGSARGRTGEGAFWGVALGPIGWLIVFLRADLRPKCPACFGVVVDRAPRCKNCAADLEWFALNAGPPGTEWMATKFTPRLRQVPPAARPAPKIHRPIPRIK